VRGFRQIVAPQRPLVCQMIITAPGLKARTGTITVHDDGITEAAPDLVDGAGDRRLNSEVAD
jgi:hypothetical protein